MVCDRSAPTTAYTNAASANTPATTTMTIDAVENGGADNVDGAGAQRNVVWITELQQTDASGEKNDSRCVGRTVSSTAKT